MQYKIDQSGKIEQTEKDTVIAFANGKQKSLLLKAEDKRKIQQVFREAGKPYMFIYRTFAVLIFLLIKDELADISSLIIDLEYPGKEKIIKHELLDLIRTHKLYFDKNDIHFDRVDHSTGAHIRALSVLRGNTAPDMQITYEDVLIYIV